MPDYLVSSLKRLYDDCSRAIDENNARAVGGAIIDRYNEILDEIQEEYSDNRRIQELEAVQRTGATFGGGPPRARANDLQDVKFRSAAIADALELELEDFERVADTETIPIIQLQQSVEQNQSQQQAQQQRVTIEQLYDDLDSRMGPEDEIEQLRELVEELEDQLNSENPDTVEIRDLIETAKSYSTQLGMKMAMLALERGIDILGDIGAN
ncbi:hypothetical protein Hrd1104_00205 [Halorhabdus sp. CBA1104]|uniref:hypothetical protein n=1 Tax=Halorhabdus sp. CBA1104 TaxID=1380432 RepID=UPI0012B1E0D6|nr:hypothetical protein [Halorhabdus sp. CBA1104]QGN05865.1 hypothetical protein Hrd1104_00205 [Halorhabdus sp. CBA1104]